MSKDSRIGRKMQLEDVKDVLASDNHYSKTETRHYGDLDPIAATYNHIVPCKCGNLFPQITKAKLTDRVRYYVKCSDCGATSQHTKKPWQAVLKWNGCDRSVHYHYENLPFFQLRGLNITDARARLVSIKDDLLFRKREATLRREKASPIERPGVKYYERLEAYLAWALHGLDIIREAGREKFKQETS